MRVLHLAAGNRWTGAAAPAFAEVEALRAAGVDAHYAYVGGYKLEKKIGHLDFAHAIIEKSQNPVSFVRSAHAVEKLADGFDVVHAHLTYDHWLARLATRGRATKVVRTFHSRRVLRGDPMTRSLIASSAAIFVTNDTLAGATPIRDRHPLFTPPPVDHRQFTPAGEDVRETYGIDRNVPLVVAIGKLSRHRGFEDVLQGFARLRKEIPEARLMIIGHGEHRPVLEQLAAELAIDVIWAGYHEDDLAAHYRAANLLFFTARGSDEGHRAILEAMACGVLPVTYPLDGVSALVEREFVAVESSPAALASAAATLLRGDTEVFRQRVVEASQRFGYAQSAGRLIQAYNQIRS